MNTYPALTTLFALTLVACGGSDPALPKPPRRPPAEAPEPAACRHELNRQSFPSFGISFSVDAFPARNVDLRAPLWTPAFRSADGGAALQLGGAGAGTVVLDAQVEMLDDSQDLQMWFSEWDVLRLGDHHAFMKVGQHETGAYPHPGFNAAIAVETAYGTSVSVLMVQHDAARGDVVVRAAEQLLSTLCVTPPVSNPSVAAGVVGRWRGVREDGSPLESPDELLFMDTGDCVVAGQVCTYQGVGSAIMVRAEGGATATMYPELFGRSRLAVDFFSSVRGHPVRYHYVRQ